MAYGLPVEGDDGPFLGDRVEPAAACDVTLSVGDARRALDSSGAAQLVLVHGDGLAVGEVDAEALEGHADDVALLDVLSPVPSTVRPSVTVASVAEADGGERLVTTSDGRLLGRATVDGPDDDKADHGHEGHDDHQGHDHGDAPAFDSEHFERELTEVMEAVAVHFGDREPSAEELRAFLRDRLMAEGRSAEEADAFLDGLEEGEQGEEGD